MTDHPSVAATREILSIAQAAEMQALLRYYLSVHPGTALPRRRDFDPVQIPSALRHIVLTDVERDPYRFRVRLMGTAVVLAFGQDFTGQFLDEAFPGVQATALHRDRVAVAETGLPNYYHGAASVPFRLDFAPIERVYLPFASDGRQVDAIMAMTRYLSGADGSGP